jgi:hypothetical protein
MIGVQAAISDPGPTAFHSCSLRCFFLASLARQRFFHALLFAWLQIKGVTFHFLNDVFLQSYFCQRKLHPPTGPS